MFSFHCFYTSRGERNLPGPSANSALADLPRQFSARPFVRRAATRLPFGQRGTPSDAIHHGRKQSGLAIAYRQTLHIVARLRGPNGYAGPLPIYRISTQRASVQIFRAMRPYVVLLSFVVPALSFSRVGSELDRPPASFPHDLFNKQDIPHISPARRHNRPDILE